MKPRRALPAGVVLACMANLAHAAEALPPSPVTLSGLIQVLFGLALVIAAIIATGWVLRRVGPSQSAGGLLRVVGGVMVGPRERLVIVEIGEQWLVLGVAAGSVNLLQAMPRAAAGSAGPDEPAWLKRLLAGSSQR